MSQKESPVYAIVEAGGRQWRVEPGTQLVVNRLTGAVGSRHVLERVLLTSEPGTLRIGQPYIAGVSVLCEVLDHSRGPKVVSYKFRRRENYRRIRGHRQNVTTLLVKEIGDGTARASSAKAAEAPAKTAAAHRTPRASTKSTTVVTKKKTITSSRRA